MGARQGGRQAGEELSTHTTTTKNVQTFGHSTEVARVPRTSTTSVPEHCQRMWLSREKASERDR